MTVAVTGNLVPRRGDRFDDRGEALGDPAKHKERGVDVMPGKEFEHSGSIALQPGGQVLPLINGKCIGECGDVEIILHIDRQGIVHALRKFCWGEREDKFLLPVIYY